MGMAVSAWMVKPVLRRARIRAVIYYLESIKTARQVVLVMAAVMLCFVIIAGGAILIPVALCLFMPWPPMTKALVAGAFGAVYIAVPLVVALVLMSEQRWMRLTRANELMKDAIETDQKKR